MPSRALRSGAFALWAMVLVAFVVWPAASAWAERRVALVIGNGGYSVFPSLSNAPRDARLVARSLGELGFEVDTVLDASRAGLDAALKRLANVSDGADLALLFYAGHGLQVGGENYLIPVDAALADARNLDAEALPLPLVMHAVEHAKLRLVFLDACRDNPIAGRMQEQAATRSLGRGLAPVAAADLGTLAGLGTLISFSTAPGTVALDGAGQNSPFAAALAKHLTTPGLEIAQLLRLVRRDVHAVTKGRQVPWDNSSLTAEVVLRPIPVIASSRSNASRTLPDGNSGKRASLAQTVQAAHNNQSAFEVERSDEEPSISIGGRTTANSGFAVNADGTIESVPGRRNPLQVMPENRDPTPSRETVARDPGRHGP